MFGKFVCFFFKVATGTVSYDYTSEDNTHNIRWGRWGRVLYVRWGRVLDSIAETTTQTTLASLSQTTIVTDDLPNTSFSVGPTYLGV